MRLSLSDGAQADADAAIDWYVGDGAFVAAEDFANALGRALALLCDYPSMGEQAARGMRILTLHDFPYSLIYRIQGDEIRIIAVAHHGAGRGIGRGGGRVDCQRKRVSVAPTGKYASFTATS